MKSLLISTSCAVLLTAGAANAQASSWDGAYVGLQVGGSWAKASGPFTNADGTSPLPYSNAPSGGLVGIRAGRNWQSGQVVFGLEGDVNAALGMQARSTLSAPPTTYVVESRQSWNADLRGRLGYAFDKALVYAAGGLAFGDAHTFYGGPGYAPPTGAPFAVTTQRVGWTLGAGAEYPLSKTVIASLDYRYTDLGSRKFANYNPLIDTADNVKYAASAVLVGISYKF